MIRWYGILWVAAFGVAAWLLPRLEKYRDVKLSREDWWYMLAWGMFGAVIGGRLGYVFLYEPGYFLNHPAEIFAIWNGGMASHGGFIGVGLALWFAAKKLEVSFLALLDVIVIPAALGLALGRVGNFLNEELFSPPGLAFVAVGKNLLIAGICFVYLLRTSFTSEVAATSEVFPVRAGRVFVLFLMLYGTLRFLIEFVRVQEFPGAWGLTRGQLFTIPVILAGIFLWIALKKKRG